MVESRNCRNVIAQRDAFKLMMLIANRREEPTVASFNHLIENRKRTFPRTMKEVMIFGYLGGFKSSGKKCNLK